jgi:hypothetical protein
MATIHYKHTGTNRVSMVTFAVDDAALNLSANAWANSLLEKWGTAMKGGLTSEASMTKCTIVKGDGTDVPEVGESTNPPITGLFVMAATPPNVAALVKKRTGFGGRANRGRLFLPWAISEGDVDEVGVLSAAGVNQVQTNITAFVTALGSIQQVIANRVYDLPWDNPARVLTAVNKGKVVTSMVVDGLVATQRRRVRG